jgi:hypothetical protein
MRPGNFRPAFSETRAHVKKEAQRQTAVDPEGQDAVQPDELAAIDELIRKAREHLLKEEVKPSVADLIRLMERRRELVGSKPGPVEARWIDAW